MYAIIGYPTILYLIILVDIIFAIVHINIIHKYVINFFNAKRLSYLSGRMINMNSTEKNTIKFFR